MASLEIVGSILNPIAEVLVSLLSALKDMLINLIPLDSTVSILAISLLGAFGLSQIGFKDFTFRFVALVGIILFLLLSTI